MNETYIVASGVDAAVRQKTRSAFRQDASRPRSVSQNSSNDFAAIKSGIDSVRSLFYGSASRMPNTRTDATRRQRTLRGGSGNRALSDLDLWTEREVSRYVYDESAIYSGMIDTWAAEVIQTGFRLKPATGDADLDTLLKELLFGWDGDGGWLADCDARGLMHFWDLMTLAEETEARDGDHAFYLDAAGNNGRGSVTLIEGDRILTPYGHRNKDGFTISNGIVWNAAGYAVAVFIAHEAPQHSFCSRENGEYYPIWRPWRPAESGVVLSIDLKRATSTRRQPWLSTSIRTLDQVDDIFVAVRIALRNAACRSTYTKINDWDAFKEWLQLADPGSLTAAPVEGLTHSPNPGDHVLTNPGEDLSVLETNAPGDNADEFLKMQLGTLGLPLGMCLEEALRIFQRSFSASRMAVQGTRRRYERRQQRIKRSKVTPLLLFAIACHQQLSLLPDDPRCSRILCGYPGWPYMEPLTDAKASQVMVESHLRSRRTCAIEVGDDFDSELPLMAEEDAMWPPESAAQRTETINIGGQP